MQKNWIVLPFIIAAVAGLVFWLVRQQAYRQTPLLSPTPSAAGPSIIETTPEPQQYEILSLNTTSVSSEIVAITEEETKRRILFTDRLESRKIRSARLFDEGRKALALLAKKGEESGSILAWLGLLGAGKSVILLENFGTLEAPLPSPDGKSVAYITFSNADPDYGYQLIIMNADGSSKRRLLRREILLTSPAFRPDGRKLAYISDIGGGTAIEVVDVEGVAEPVRIAEFANETVYDLFWGKELFFGKRPQGETSANKGEIYAISEAGSSLRRITQNDSFDGNPVPSPDGLKIALVRTAFKDGKITSGADFTVLVIDLQAGTEKELGTADAVLGWRAIQSE